MNWTNSRFLLKEKSGFAGQLGFTLIEIMIVLAILGGLVAFGLPRLKSPKESIKTVTREMTVLFREIRNEARLKQRTHRIVFQFEGEDHRYWVESAEGAVLAKTIEELRQEASAKDEEGRSLSPFQRSEKFSKKDRELPRKLYFASVETKRDPEPITSGTAYVYFSPEGLVDQASVQVTNRQNITWSLVINPLTGQTDVVQEPVRLEQLKVE
jgi:general secretion pathway protein H